MRPDADDRDYPAESALKDLIKIAGLTDDRLHAALTDGTLPLTRDTWLVGVHVRRQNSIHGARGTSTPPVLVTVLVAARARSGPNQPWTFHMYVPGHGRAGHADGTARFHARPIGISLGDGHAPRRYPPHRNPHCGCTGQRRRRHRAMTRPSHRRPAGPQRRHRPARYPRQPDLLPRERRRHPHLAARTHVTDLQHRPGRPYRSTACLAARREFPSCLRRNRQRPTRLRRLARTPGGL